MIDPPLHRPLALRAFVLRAVGISTLALVAVAGLVAGSGAGSAVASALVSDACSTLPSTMTAVLTSGSSPDGATSGGWNLRLSDDVPVPCPGPGQVLVKVLTTAVNPVDWKILEDGSLSLLLSFPHVMGMVRAPTCRRARLCCSQNSVDGGFASPSLRSSLRSALPPVADARPPRVRDRTPREPSPLLVTAANGSRRRSDLNGSPRRILLLV